MQCISHQAFQVELDKIIEGLRSYAPQKVILFGSFARGDVTTQAGNLLKDTKVTKKNPGVLCPSW